jgi:hypothetical protein
MADFSVNATTLSAPTGAGSQVVSPVRVAPTESQDIPGIGMGVLTSVVDVFNKGLIQTRKEDAEKVKNAVVQSYIREETTLNDAVESGQMTPSQAAARSRANFNKYAAGHGQYIEDFQKAGSALRGFTAKGEVEKQLEVESKRLEADVSEAQKRGFVFLPNMSPSARDAQIQASKTSIRAEAALSDMYKANAEKRAQGTYDAGVAAREEKDLGFKLVNEIAGQNLTAFQEFNKSLADSVRNGKEDPQMALVKLNERFANISGALQSAARTNPELAGPYRSMFEDMYKIGQKLIDPKENAEQLQNQLAVITTKMKLAAMNDPKVAAAVVANQLLPNNASLALSSAPEGVRAMAILSSIPVGDRSYTPQVVGNPDAEESTLKLLKGGLSDLRSGKVQNKEIAAVQASNSVNHILKQTGEMIDKGASPQQLKGVAQFFASPEYAGFVTSGQIDPQAAGTAKKTFQLLYEPAVIKGVQERMSQVLFDPKQLGLAAGGGSGSEATSNQTVGDTINIKFSGSGIVFETRAGAGMAPTELRSQRLALESLRSAQQAINQVIHIGAHMEGSTDYGKYWEDNKHIYMPGYYIKGVKEGDVRNGYQYLGGNASMQSSWKKVQDGGTK